MLKHVLVPIIIDDHDPEKCGRCQYCQSDEGWCFLFHQLLYDKNRCKQCQEDVSCTTHHACKCIQERLDRIEAVWREHKHLDYLLIDKTWLGGDTSLNNIFYDLWQAIRREE